MMILPFSAAVVLAAGIAGRLMPRVGPRRPLILGLLLIVGGAAAAWFSTATGAFVVGLVLAGLGNGMGAVAAYAFGLAVPAEQEGSAAGLLNTAAQIGTATMVAATVAIAGHGSGIDYRLGWLTVGLTAIAVITSVGAATRTRLRH